MPQSQTAPQTAPLTAASPIEIQAKADEAGLPAEARDAALRLFHDLTSRLGLASIELDGDGEDWPRHRFLFGAGDTVAGLIDRLRARPDAAEATLLPAHEEPPPVLFVSGSDGGYAAVLVACADAATLRAATGASAPGGGADDE